MPGRYWETLCHPTLHAARGILRRICINERSKLHIADEMTTYPEVSLHWLPPAYRVEQSDILLVLRRRREGSVTRTLDGQRTVAETVERYAREDSTRAGGAREAEAPGDNSHGFMRGCALLHVGYAIGAGR